MQIIQRIFKCSDMFFNTFFLDKILKPFTYHTPFYTINRRTVINSKKKHSVFLVHHVLIVNCAPREQSLSQRLQLFARTESRCRSKIILVPVDNVCVCVCVCVVTSTL